MPETLLPAQKGDVLECDELWSFAASKRRECWLWVALCRRTRQVVAWALGDRSETGARLLRERLPPDYRGRASRSDLWRACGAAFPKRTHRPCTKQEGETCHVERFFGTLRQRMARLVRRTLSFSRHPGKHEQWLSVFLTTYNLKILNQLSG